MFNNQTQEYNNSTSTEGISMMMNYIYCALMNVIAVLILFGNIMVMGAIAKYEQLQTITNKFIVSLATADLLVGIVLPYHSLFMALYPTFEDSVYHCVFKYSSVTVTCCSSIGSILIVAIDRCIAIVWPLKYPIYITPQSCNIAICTVWIVATIFGCVPVYANHWMDGSLCFYFEVVPWQFNLVVLILYYATTFVVMIIYYKIFQKARIQEQKIALETARVDREEYKNRLKGRKTAKTLAIIIGTFLGCWSPFMFTLMISYWWKSNSIYTLFTVSVIIGVLNSSMNPAIYCWKNREFKKVFKKMLGIRSNRIEGGIPVSSST